MNDTFEKMLIGLNTKGKIEATQLILHRYKEGVANDSKFYSNDIKIKIVYDKIIDTINTTDQYLEALVRICSKGPYNIFQFVLQEDYSDIVIHKDGINLLNNNENEKWKCDDSYKELYHIFINALIDNITYIASTKFDTANNILDMEVGKFRFNIIHKSLTNSGFPVIVIRKQTIKKSIHMSEEYINSLGCSQDQIDVIHKFAKKGNVIIFGEVGSGKSIWDKQEVTVYRKRKDG